MPAATVADESNRKCGRSGQSRQHEGAVALDDAPSEEHEAERGRRVHERDRQKQDDGEHETDEPDEPLPLGHGVPPRGGDAFDPARA